MGCNFCRKKGYVRINYLAPDEKEIVLKDYSSLNDAPLSIFESKQNYFTQIQLVEFINLLEQFNIETSEVITDEPMRSNFSSKDDFLEQSMSLEEFINFIDNNILISGDLINVNENDVIFFKKFCIEMYKSLESKLKEHYKDDKVFDSIKKRNIITLGILFCDCENIEKIKLFFDILKNDDKKEFIKNEVINDFLITLFLIGSYCLVNTRSIIFDEKNGIKKLGKDDLLNIFKISELKHCEILVETFNENFFKKESYNWPDFKKQFEDVDKGFGWILSSKGIRRKLEEINN
jgi:hypothetical protein